MAIRNACFSNLLHMANKANFLLFPLATILSNNASQKDLCTKAKYQRIIERHEFAEALEKNKENISKNPEIYAQRQSIVVHPFGTMKRQCNVMSLSK
jgi:hypothetical protein